MIWTRIKRWLAMHPLWCILATSPVALCVVVLVVQVVAMVLLMGYRGSEPGTVLVVLVAGGICGGWFVAGGVVAWLVGMLRGRAGLPLDTVRRRLWWVWLALAPLSWPMAAMLLALAMDWDERPGFGSFLAIVVGALVVAAVPALGALAGLHVAELWTRRRMASGRWVTIVPAPDYVPGISQDYRRRVDRWTVYGLAAFSALLVYGYLAAQVVATITVPITVPQSRVEAWIAPMAFTGVLAPVLLVWVSARLAWLRRRTHLTNADLVFISAPMPWILYPLTWLAVFLPEEIIRGGEGVIVAFLGGAGLLLASEACIVLGVGLAHAIFWWRQGGRDISGRDGPGDAEEGLR